MADNWPTGSINCLAMTQPDLDYRQLRGRPAYQFRQQQGENACLGDGGAWDAELKAALKRGSKVFNQG